MNSEINAVYKQFSGYPHEEEIQKNKDIFLAKISSILDENKLTDSRKQVILQQIEEYLPLLGGDLSLTHFAGECFSKGVNTALFFHIILPLVQEKKRDLESARVAYDILSKNRNFPLEEIPFHAIYHLKNISGNIKFLRILQHHIGINNPTEKVCELLGKIQKKLGRFDNYIESLSYLDFFCESPEEKLQGLELFYRLCHKKDDIILLQKIKNLTSSAVLLNNHSYNQDSQHRKDKGYIINHYELDDHSSYSQAEKPIENIKKILKILMIHRPQLFLFFIEKIDFLKRLGHVETIDRILATHLESLSTEELSNHYQKLLGKNNPQAEKKKKQFQNFLTKGGIHQPEKLYVYFLDVWKDYLFAIVTKKTKQHAQEYLGKNALEKDIAHLIHDSRFLISYIMSISTRTNQESAKMVLSHAIKSNTLQENQQTPLEETFPYCLEKNKKYVEKYPKIGGFIAPKPWTSTITRKNNKNESETKKYLVIIQEKLQLLGIKKTFQKATECIYFCEQHIFSASQDLPYHLVEDIRLQYSQLIHLENTSLRETHQSKTITIYKEHHPINIINMGNDVEGSCLSFYSNVGNYWSVFANAIDINKGVLMIKDEEGRLLGRCIIAVDHNMNLVKFPIYYSKWCDIDLQPYVKDYIRGLALKLDFGINGNPKKVDYIYADDWYCDPSIAL